jgi:hypothetical protein
MSERKNFGAKLFSKPLSDAMLKKREMKETKNKSFDFLPQFPQALTHKHRRPHKGA